MGITVRWFDESNSTLWYEFVGKWTWDDLYSAISEGIRLSAGVIESVNSIIDMRRSQYVPMLSADHLSKVATLSLMSCSEAGVLMVGAGHFVQLMFDIFRRIHPLAAERYRFVETLDDARAAVKGKVLRTEG